MPDVAGLERKDLYTGARYLKLHHFADPEKGDQWLEDVRREMADTPYEFRREILMEDAQAKGALWKTDWFHRYGFRYPPCLRKDPDTGKIVAHIPEDVVKIVVAIDPSVTDKGRAKDPNKEPDQTGLVGIGVTADKRAIVLADMSAVMDTEVWAKRAVKLARILGAPEIWYEANNGGDLIRNTIKPYLNQFPELGDEPLRIHDVRASQGKRIRAEPVAVRYETGRVHHCGHLSGLETQMVTWDASDPNAESPGAIDATVVAFHALKLAEFKAATVHKRVQARNQQPKHDFASL